MFFEAGHQIVPPPVYVSVKRTCHKLIQEGSCYLFIRTQILSS